MEQDLSVEQIIQFVAWDRVPLAFVVVVVAWVGMTLLTRFLNDLGERIVERRLFLKKVEALTRFALYGLLALTLVTSLLDVPAGVMFTLLGTSVLAFGFAFKDLLASLMAGVILLIDEPFQLGDRVKFGDWYGEVTAMGLRSVRITTLDDNLVTIPNSSFLTDTVASANAGALDCMVVVPFYIACGEDFYLARRLVAEATATSRYVFLDKPLTTTIRDEFMGERFVTVIQVKAYVFDARYETAFASDVTERVKVAFRRAGIRGPDQAYRDLEVYHRESPPEPGAETP